MSDHRFHNPYFQKPPTALSLWRSDWWAYLGCCLLLIGLAWYAVGQRHWLWINEVKVQGNAYLTTDQVVLAVQSALDEKHWLVMPQRFYPFTSEKKLNASIRERLEQQVGLAELTVDSKFAHTVEVTLKERVPGYVYIIQNQYYYLDRTGVVTSTVKQAELDPHFPHIRDRNKKRELTIDSVALKTSVMDFITQVIEQFTPTTGLDISEFAVLPVTCQEKQYVAEEIFADEIEGTQDATTKQLKKDILRRLQSDEITVDQSLALLEEIKRGESTDRANDKDKDAGSQAFVQWQAKFVERDCDYATVIQDIVVVTQAGVEIYFDSTMNLEQQLRSLALLLEAEKIDSAKLEYIDIRFSDRAYYR